MLQKVYIDEIIILILTIFYINCTYIFFYELNEYIYI